MNIGAQLYTVREYTQNPDGIKKTFQKIKNIGFDMVQISGFSTENADEIIAALKENNITVSCTHVPYERLTNDIDELIKEHKTIGCGIMGLGYMPQDIYPCSYDGFMSFCEFANITGERLSKEGILFAYHNHRFEFMKFGEKTGMDLIVENTNPSYFGLIPDLYWIMAGGVCPVYFLEKYAERCKVVHLKDMAIHNDEQRFAAVGDGNMDYKRIVQTIKNLGIKNTVIEQDECYGEDPFDCLQKSKIYLEGLAL